MVNAAAAAALNNQKTSNETLNQYQQSLATNVYLNCSQNSCSSPSSNQFNSSCTSPSLLSTPSSLTRHNKF